MTNLKNILLGTAIGLAACGGETAPSIRDVSRGEFQRDYDGSVYVVVPLEGQTVKDALGEYFRIVDIDGDGEADALVKSDTAYWASGKYSGRNIPFKEDSAGLRIMTPEIQKAATMVLGSQRDLALLIAQRHYYFYTAEQRADSIQKTRQEELGEMQKQADSVAHEYLDSIKAIRGKKQFSDSTKKVEKEK